LSSITRVTVGDRHHAENDPRPIAPRQGLSLFQFV
jgi:hypothetical protein